MNFNRINLNSGNKVNNGENLQGNYSSVIGEYYVEDYGKTGFFKANDYAGENSDLRELLGSLILNSAGIRAADIQLAQNENGEEGCLSMNVLRAGEQFLQNSVAYNPQNVSIPQFPAGIDGSIQLDLYTYGASYPSIPQEFWEQRKEFLKRYIFLSAFIGNADIKSDNCQIIFNENDGTVRNPEMYYDMGMAFGGPDGSGRFFDGKTDLEVMQEMYQKYPQSIEELSKSLQKYLTKDYINGILNMPVFRGISEEDIEKIWCNLGKKMAMVTKQNEILYGVRPQETSVLTSLRDIAHVVAKTPVQVYDNTKPYVRKMTSGLVKEERGH